MSIPSIAIVGASPDRSKFGNKAVRAFASKGYHVYPIHPKADRIEGWQVYPRVEALPVDELNGISIYLPAAVCLPLLPEIARKRAKKVWFNPGADDPDVIAAARSLGINVVVGCSIVAIGASPSDLD